MTDDRFARRLPTLLHELAGDDEAYVEDVLTLTADLSQRRAWTFIPGLSAIDDGVSGSRTRARVLAIALVAAILAGLVAAALVVGSRLLAEPQPGVVSNGWIAFSTSGPSPGSTDDTTGADIYLVREGVAPRLIAGREGGTTRNICPAFSPDGNRLAFGVSSTVEGSAVLVLGIDPRGVPTEGFRLAVVGPVATLCPRWSSDGMHVAYLADGAIVVRGMDGAVLTAGPFDPTLDDFGVDGQGTNQSTYERHFLSPAGDRVAWLRASDCSLNIARPDGTAPYVIPVGMCAYAIAAWSPDGRNVLLMEDVSGHDFMMHVIAVDSPFERTTVQPSVRTNGARSWPGWGDVSWQAVYR